jgi:hypothetical protein
MQRNIMMLSRNHCCHGTSTVRPICIVVYLHITVNNIKPLSVVTEGQEWVPLALLSGYKLFRTI